MCSCQSMLPAAQGGDRVSAADIFSVAGAALGATGAAIDARRQPIYAPASGNEPSTDTGQPMVRVLGVTMPRSTAYIGGGVAALGILFALSR